MMFLALSINVVQIFFFIFSGFQSSKAKFKTIVVSLQSSNCIGEMASQTNGDLGIEEILFSHKWKYRLVDQQGIENFADELNSRVIATHDLVQPVKVMKQHIKRT